MSLAEWTVMERIASSTLIVAPGRRPRWLGAIEAAWLETVIISVALSRPVESASNARYSVMILVIDAG